MVTTDAAALKTASARAALDEVRPGMALGLGSGSTAEAFVRLLGERAGVLDGLRCVPTSARTGELARSCGLTLATLDELPSLDLVIDGADEIGPDLALVKGGGGALLREKIVAAASARMVVIADEAKLVDALGRYPLPIEVDRFGLTATVLRVSEAVATLGLAPTLAVRERDGGQVVTDGGHAIIDASFGLIPDPVTLARALSDIPGVVEHGLFLGMADLALVAGPSGVRRLTARRT